MPNGWLIFYKFRILSSGYSSRTQNHESVLEFILILENRHHSHHTRHCPRLSSRSWFPSGNSHKPLYSPYLRWIARIFPSWWILFRIQEKRHIRLDELPDSSRRILKTSRGVGPKNYLFFHFCKAGKKYRT